MASLFKGHTVELLRKGGSTVAADEIFGTKKYVFLYFSAHWCPPCRGFTPQLKTFYEQHHLAHNFEIVFVSRDHSAEEMRAYFHDAHGDWLALNYRDAQELGNVWADQYGVLGIPCLLVMELGTTPRLVTFYGRDMVAQDPQALEFPWLNADVIVKARRRAMLRKAMMCVAVMVLVLYILMR